MISRRWGAILANLILILVSMIWGTTYVYQRIANDILDPFFFTAVRFLVGAISLLPLYTIFYIKTKRNNKTNKTEIKNSILFGSIAGVILLLAIMTQQIGLIFSSAAKAGFISGMYVIFTPIVSVFLFREKKQNLIVYFICLLAFLGLVVLSLETETMIINQGDLLLLFSALFWAIQIVYISRVANKIDAILFSIAQFLSCSLLCFFIAYLIGERFSITAIEKAAGIILFTGIVSVGICFSIQVFAQKFASAVSVAVIFSLESIFAALAEAIILKELLSFHEVIGCLLILSAIILMQIHLFKAAKKNKVLAKNLKTP